MARQKTKNPQLRDRQGRRPGKSGLSHLVHVSPGLVEPRSEGDRIGCLTRKARCLCKTGTRADDVGKPQRGMGEQYPRLGLIPWEEVTERDEKVVTTAAITLGLVGSPLVRAGC